MKTKNKKILFSLPMLLLISAGLMYPALKDEGAYGANIFLQNKEDLAENEEESDDPNTERKFFEQWHEPYGTVLEPDHMDRIWRDIKSLPDERSMNPLPVNSWGCVGPLQNHVASGSTEYTGRILDIEIAVPPPPAPTADLRIAAASGGVWGIAYIFFLPFPGSITNGITSQATSTFASKPGDHSTVIVGTGEYYQRGGTGLWRTTNAGTTWTNIPTNPSPSAYFRIRYTPGNLNRIHAATSNGYFRSDDGGLSWTQRFAGVISDLAINPSNTNQVYITKWGDNVSGGLYYSLNGGDTWTKNTATGIPTTNVGRSAVSICTSSPGTLYTLMARNDNDLLLGVFRSVNSGASWTNITPSVDIGGNGWYNAVIGVCPTNSNIVLCGMTSLARTSNGGSTWSLITDADVHADQHAITWRNNGTDVYAGTDGGISNSGDAGATWNTSYNFFAVSQFYNFDVGTNNTSVVFGGTQDNGICGTTNLSNQGGNWNHLLGGDGAGVAIDPTNAVKIYAVNGAYGGSWLFWRQKSANSGQSWSSFNTGLPANTDWAPKIRAGIQNPPVLYTNATNSVYYSPSSYTSWTLMNTFSGTVTNLIVPNTSSDRLFVCVGGGAQKLMYYYSSTWHDVSAGLLTTGRVRSVQSHYYGFIYGTYTYAVMNGLLAGQKIYRTTDAGVSWTNVSGDLPNVPLADVVIHPTNRDILYLGSEFGCYRTTNGGSSWHRWNNGMPESNIVTEMDYIDSMSTVNKFYVLAATYGRSIWMREINGDDPVSIGNNNSNIPDKFVLYQNYPNPFNPATKIKFDIPQAGAVRLVIFDILGREVASLVNKELKAGTHEISWDASKFTSGIYFYTIKAGDFTDTKKMILVK
jgi:photosystem II stability/assembly factor-like uncharacterized protein